MEGHVDAVLCMAKQKNLNKRNIFRFNFTFCILTSGSYFSIFLIFFFPDCFVDIRMWNIASRYLINCIGFKKKKKKKSGFD
jgi:hypothetical protein